MNEQEALNKMIAPGTRRPGKYREGVIQIHITRSCDNACFNCTQGSNLGGRSGFIRLENFEAAVKSLTGYFGVVGVFGGNPALHPDFPRLCEILRTHIPWEQRGLWCNSPQGHGKVMRETFNPSVSNLNVHLSQAAYDEFKRDWPECNPVGLHNDSRHSPCYVAMKDVLKKECDNCCNGVVECFDAHGSHSANCSKCAGTGRVYDESRAWELISDCDINKHWSAMIGEFRGQVRAWFCEIAGAQAMLHQHEEDYPDTGLYPDHPQLNGAFLAWWQRSMFDFSHQVRKHCHECSVPLRGHGELAMAETPLADEKMLDPGEAILTQDFPRRPREQVSATHASVYKLKRKGRQLDVVTELVQLGTPLARMTNYLGNAKT